MSSRRKRSTRGARASPGRPLLELGPLLQQCDQVPVAPPFPGAPGAPTRNSPRVTDKSWHGRCVVRSLQTFLSLLCPRRRLETGAQWTLVLKGHVPPGEAGLSPGPLARCPLPSLPPWQASCGQGVGLRSRQWHDQWRRWDCRVNLGKFGGNGI